MLFYFKMTAKMLCDLRKTKTKYRNLCFRGMLVVYGWHVRIEMTALKKWSTHVRFEILNIKKGFGNFLLQKILYNTAKK